MVELLRLWCMRKILESILEEAREMMPREN